MGSTISKAKQLDIKTFVANYKQHDTSTPLSGSTLVSPTSSEDKPHHPFLIKNKLHRKKIQTASRRYGQNAKRYYRKVTKSIIGKPTNFKHTGHMGSGEIRSGQIDADVLSLHMMEITSRLDPTEYVRPRLTVRNKDSSLAKRAAAAIVSSNRASTTPLSSLRSQQRHKKKPVIGGKYRRMHHPALVIEIPSMKSIITK